MNVNNNSSSRQKAMKKLQEASFASYDNLLYLDSHPCDKRALRSFEKYNALRREAAREYAEMYGPVNPDNMTTDDEMWRWAVTPWPWEE